MDIGKAFYLINLPLLSHSFLIDKRSTIEQLFVSFFDSELLLYYSITKTNCSILERK